MIKTFIRDLFVLTLPRKKAQSCLIDFIKPGQPTSNGMMMIHNTIGQASIAIVVKSAKPIINGLKLNGLGHCLTFATGYLLRVKKKDEKYR